ncbi:MAG TPA: type IV toxin-antitoxin system AbiEi family antitoxin domain-containing protein [Thermoplasmata archaeon]
MPLTYGDALASLFGSKPFTAREFARRANVPRAAKILSELKRRGLVERIGRGTYRCLGPEERPDLRTAEWSRVRNIILGGPTRMAWAGRSAVELWTGGRYRIAPSPFYRIFEVAVPADRMEDWRNYLADRNVATHLGKRVGARVDLVPVGRVKSIEFGGEPVIPRASVEATIDEHPALYAGARDLLLDGP